MPSKRGSRGSAKASAGQNWVQTWGSSTITGVAVVCLALVFAWYLRRRPGAGELDFETGSDDSRKVELMQRLRKNPNDLASLEKLCNLFGKSFRRTGDDAVAADVVRCHGAMITALNMPSAKQYLGTDGILEYAVISASQIYGIARGRTERLEAAAAGYVMALSNRSRCDGQSLFLPFHRANAGSCVTAWAKLQLILKQLGRKLPHEVWQGPSRLVGGSPHLQLPGIRAQPVWSVESIPWLASMAEDLRAAVLADWAQLSNYKFTENKLLADGSRAWFSETLLINDEWDPDLCNDCPNTCKLLKPRHELLSSSAKLPDPKVNSDLELTVSYHMLKPGAKLSPHHGRHGRLLASLGVESYEGSLLQVGDEVLKWSEEHFIVFDDSFPHEVVNHGDKPRIVFTFAFVHPDLMSQP